MRRFLLLAITCGALLADNPRGIPARSDVRLYRGTTSTDSYDLGVTLLPEAVVKQQFSSEIYRGYIVVEVAFFPKNGSTVNVNHADFSLRNKATGEIAYAARPDLAAGVLQKAASRKSVSVYPESSIGYESGGYDPVYGGRRRGGVYTSTGVGVGVGNPQRPGSSPQDRQVMQSELEDKQLPDGSTAQPIAGYLYFPITTRHKETAYEVVFRAPQGPIALNAGHR